MASVYAKGNQLYMRVKDEKGLWRNRRTPYLTGLEADARRYASAAQASIEKRRKETKDGPLTVTRYAEAWARERDERGVRSALGEIAILRRHALPHVGHHILAKLTPEHVRDMVRALVKLGTMAPRSVGHVYGTLHTMYEDAVTEGRVATNPVRVKRGELPRKLDKDPEWRGQATYARSEVERLIDDPRIPPERRVLYALKALAGLRHGEAAALRWRHWDPVKEPLGQLTVAVAFDSHRLEEKRTKTGTTRYVPVHPLLAEILRAWKDQHWKRMFKKDPGPDDLIVPFYDLGPVHKNEAQGAFKHDLGVLGLRREAGSQRSRGGHDLRAWFKTECVEQGADSNLIRRVTHAPPKDVDSGYLRFSWATYCREVAKLVVTLPSGSPLTLDPEGYGTRKGNYWRNGWRRDREVRRAQDAQDA